jgi:hypothetical protein
MRRGHRAAHRVLWYALTLAVAIGLGAALTLRPPVPVDANGPTAGGGP